MPQSVKRTSPGDRGFVVANSVQIHAFCPLRARFTTPVHRWVTCLHRSPRAAIHPEYPPRFSLRLYSRAFRIAGDYGSGKSAFGLALARIAEGISFRRYRREFTPLLPAAIRMSPRLATGDHEPLGVTVLRALGIKLPRGSKANHSRSSVEGQKGDWTSKS